MTKVVQLLVGISLFITSLLASAADEHYTIFIDAGSSGSRLHLFAYKPTLPVPVIQDVFFTTNHLPLSSYSDDPASAGQSLQKLFEEALQQMKVLHINTRTVSVNILATAGMRLLPEDKQNSIYHSLRQYLSQNYDFSIGEIKTISGAMEGVYGWLDINYLLGNFTHKTATVGTIDMGGSSTEITFATQDTTTSKDKVILDIGDQHYAVFSKSFLGLGQDQALAKMQTYATAANCYPPNYIFNKDSPTGGRFNLSACAAIYANLLTELQVKEQIIVIPTQPFYAFSGIYYTYNFFDADKMPDKPLLENRIENVCNMAWEQLKKAYPHILEKHLATYCANAAYEDQLLYSTYEIKGTNLTITNKINGKNIDWTLGAALFSLTHT